ncbi:hypothetical protein AAVH_15612 [Aphelenchoides avenae]|nr:hypothetical protein AAVH_15612 [Aphelenchus avenae]
MEDCINRMILEQFLKYTENRDHSSAYYNAAKTIDNYMIHGVPEAAFKFVNEGDSISIHLRSNQYAIKLKLDFVPGIITEPPLE